MAIRKSKQIYVTDRGDECYVENMHNTHLANTIAHLEKKILALRSTIDFANDSELNKKERESLEGHIECLQRDQLILARELANRESCKDEC